MHEIQIKMHYITDLMLPAKYVNLLKLFIMLQLHAQEMYFIYHIWILFKVKPTHHFHKVLNFLYA